MCFPGPGYLSPQEAHPQPGMESYFDGHHSYPPQMVPNVKMELPWSQAEYPGCRDMAGSWSPTEFRLGMPHPGYPPLHPHGELGSPTEGKPMIQAAALAGYSGGWTGWLYSHVYTGKIVRGAESIKSQESIKLCHLGQFLVIHLSLLLLKSGDPTAYHWDMRRVHHIVFFRLFILC